LIRPTVWPQYTNVTDRTDSIGRTVLQTVAQKVTKELYFAYWGKALMNRSTPKIV